MRWKSRLVTRRNYIDNIKKVLKGDATIQLDTTQIAQPKAEISND